MMAFKKFKDKNYRLFKNSTASLALDNSACFNAVSPFESFSSVFAPLATKAFRISTLLYRAKKHDWRHTI